MVGRGVVRSVGSSKRAGQRAFCPRPGRNGRVGQLRVGSLAAPCGAPRQSELSDPTPTLTTMLTVRDHQTLNLAFAHFAYPAIRAARALDELGYSETRFWQVVRHLLEQPAAEAAYPADVRRLRRLHEARARQRSMRQVG